VTVALSVVGEATEPALRRLWQLYQHDLSEFRGTFPGPNGMFNTERVDSYLVDPNCRAYLIESESRPAGFALVRGLNQDSRVLGEFFVVRAARRAGNGRDAAIQVIARHPGRWSIAFQDNNVAASAFWRMIATDIAAESWELTRRPVPGKPHVPLDSWIEFTTTA
jgi:predicted acetyltransferase